MSERRNRISEAEIMRCRLPYGIWICMNGSQILFNRDYNAIWLKPKEGGVVAIDPDARIIYTEQVFFFNDNNPPWINKRTLEGCIKVLREWGVEAYDPRAVDLLIREKQACRGGRKRFRHYSR